MLVRQTRQVLHCANRHLFGFTASKEPTTKPPPMEYAERRVLGYTREQMWDVVASVDEYHEFVPWCTHSAVNERRNGIMYATLGIGFGPIQTSYNCHVIVARPHLVKSVACDTPMFRQLLSEWKFTEGRPGVEKSCTLHFDVVFDFTSSMHAHLAHVFFDKVVNSMVNAFLERAKTIYGPPSVAQENTPKVLVHRA